MSDKYQYNKKYAEKHLKEKYDEIKIRVPKGQKEAIKKIAERNGESVNSFIVNCITEYSERLQSKVE
jgi:uncharacterized protein (DUF1778 family)